MTERIETGGPGMELELGAPERAAYDAAARRAIAERWVERLASRDVTLWSADPAVGRAIADRLGWLDAPNHFAGQTAALETFGEELRANGFTAAVVAGMGGSSLAPLVLRDTFGAIDDWLDVRVLDSTDPAAVAAVVDDLDPLTTLFIVATKSGTTTEPLAFQADAWARITAALKERHAERKEGPGSFMALVSDPGRSVGSIPHQAEIPSIFLNPPDIGGRYAALTYVGLLPGSLLGLDLDELLASAQMMAAAGTTRDDPAENAPLALGLAMGTLARNGRDKLTIIADPEIASFGMWLEQLIAESTGKHGVGIVPVDAEPLGASGRYGADRVFVRIAMEGSPGPDPVPGSEVADADELLAELAALGHPVIRITLSDPMDLGGEFVRWEIATAIAGAVLEIDPFDQPNVEEAKQLTRALLERHDREAAPAPIARGQRIAVYADRLFPATGAGTPGGASVADVLAAHLGRRGARSYLAIQAFIAPSAAADAAFVRMRRQMRDATGCATTSGYGPRFLHSTGQLHKGGAAIGVFLQLTSGHPKDRPIPGWPYSFGHLVDAQAAGDFGAIEQHDLPIVRVDLGDDIPAGLAELEAALAAALAR